MIAPHILERARVVTLAEAAHLLGLKVPRAGEYAGPCPACGGRDRFSVNPRKGVWNCRGAGGGNDAISLVGHVHGVDFRGAVEFLTGERDLPPKPRPRSAPQPVEDDEAERVARARALWRDAYPARGTIVDTYLTKARGLPPLDVATARTIRFHPAFPMRDPAGELVRVPAMLCAMRNPRAALDFMAGARGDLDEVEDQALADEEFIRAVSCLALADDGRSKRFGPQSRKFRGVAKGAGVILGDMWSLYYGGAALHVAEGVETALAVRRLFGAELVVALGSAGAIRDLEFMPCVRRLVIHAERDESGTSERAALECFTRWRERIDYVEIVAPRESCDANDVLMREASA